MANMKITPRDVDFAKWYTDVVMAAHLASYTEVKGCIAIEPNGYAIWEEMQKILDQKFKELGHVNVQMPLLIPENLLKKEADLVEGFAPEVAWVTMGGNKNLEERFCIRPTSETMFSDYFKNHITSYKDLPLLYNQWCNVMRWEKETRPFLRSREFLWQEGHTIHETKEEAEEETKRMMDVYKWFHHDILAIPSITGRKTEKEKFAGADYTLTNEALMYNGVSLQASTSHFFGQRFSKAYDIKYTTRDNKQDYVYQTSWGTTTRMIGALIMVHSDDKGLVLPPNIAPRKVVIIPIGKDEEVLSWCEKINQELNENNIKSFIDQTDKSPGFKFAEAEVLGIPLRIEIGKRDLDNNQITFTRRDTSEKIIKKLEIDIKKEVSELLNTIQQDMYNRALKRRDELTFEAKTIEDVKKIMNTQPGFIKADWCGNPECELKMKEINGLKSRCILEDKMLTGKCVVCGREAKELVVWGIQY